MAARSSYIRAHSPAPGGGHGLFGQGLPTGVRWAGHRPPLDHPRRARNRDQPMVMIAPCRVSPGRHNAAMAGAISAGLGSAA